MRFLVWICALAMAGNLSAYAFSVSPTYIVVEEDEGARVSIRFAAESGLVPIELTIIERLPGGILAPASDSLIRAHPPQLLLEPGEPRSVLIEIASGIAKERGRSFYVRIEQLGLRTVRADAGQDQEIIVLTTYLLPVHIIGHHAPVLTASLSAEPAGAQAVVSNHGKGPARLSGCSLRFTARSGAEREIDGRWLAEQIGADAILPGETILLDLRVVNSDGQAQPEMAPAAIRAVCDPS